jgi:histone H3/H4
VESRVREILKRSDMRLGGDVMVALNMAVMRLISKAAGRAKENGRCTVQEQDV